MYASFRLTRGSPRPATSPARADRRLSGKTNNFRTSASPDSEGGVRVCVIPNAGAAHFAFEIWTRFEFIAGCRRMMQ